MDETSPAQGLPSAGASSHPPSSDLPSSVPISSIPPSLPSPDAPPATVPDAGFNFRDISRATGFLRKGRVFRSSQFYTRELLAAAGIRTVLDLRKNADNRGVTTQDLSTSSQEENGACDGEQQDCTTIPLDLVTNHFKAAVFGAMPLKVSASACWRIVTGRSPDTVMAPAVADPEILGYDKLYVLFLKNSKRQIFEAIKIFTEPSAYPILVHCVHGKDRTGLVLMLVQRICGVPIDVIMADYMASASSLAAWGLPQLQDGAVPLKGEQALKGETAGSLPEHLRGQHVLSTKEGYMAAAIAHVEEQNNGIDGYMDACGVNECMRQRLRSLLLSTEPDCNAPARAQEPARAVDDVKASAMSSRRAKSDAV